MKVCFVTANYPPEANGGTEQVVVALARELRARAVEVLVLCGSDEPHAGPSSQLEEQDGVLVERFYKKADEHDRHGFVRPRLLRLIEGRLERHRPDVVHVHSFAGIGFGLAALGHAVGVPVVATFHDQWITCARYFRLPRGGVRCPDDVDHAACTTCVLDALATEDRGFVSRGLDERFRMARQELAGVARCLAPSRTAAETVRRCLPYDGEIEVIPHGLLRSVPAAERRATDARPDGPLRIGSFGGLVAAKGMRELVAAARGLACEVHLSGPFHEPAFERELRELAARDGTTLVLHGPFSARDPHPARQLDLAVFPSKCQETYGLVVDEALAHGVPVLCSDAGAFAERTATPGVRTTPLEGLASALQELVAFPDRLEALRMAIPAELPTIARSAERHLALYQSLA